MKNIFKYIAKIFAISSIFISLNTYAQVPQKMSYQAVLRNANNELISSKPVAIQVSVLQGSATGKAVYIELHTLTTNLNGLATFEIGNGSVISGTFATINWASGQYFVKTETDPAGGTNYNISSTSQLLSVPYALYAKTVDGISATNITNWNTAFAWGNHAGLYRPITYVPDWSEILNKPAIPAAADGSETKLTAGSNVTVTGSGTTANPYVVNAGGTAPLSVGQSYQGGVIFWLDATGQHGLIAASMDLTTEQGLIWNNGTNTTTNAVRDGIGAGIYNTERIIANQGAGSYAAQLCANYKEGGYGDWYLPSKYELDLLYQQKAVVGGFADAHYWSSTENYMSAAWVQYFEDGAKIPYDKYFAWRIRAVRAF